MCRLRWARPVVEGNEVTDDSPNMVFTQEHEVIQGVVAKRPVETFNSSIRIGCVIRSRQSLDLQRLLEPEVEVAAIAFSFRTLFWMPKLPEDSVVVAARESEESY